MLIFILQRYEGHYLKWGTFDNREKAVDYINYIIANYTPSFVPSFFVVVGTMPGTFVEYSLNDYLSKED